MQLVPRAQWGARSYRTPNGATPYRAARLGVKVHYLGTAYTFGEHESCAGYVRRLQDSHMDGNGWSDIGYSFVVCEHGRVFEGRGLERRNSANGTTSLNERHYAVCALVGSSGSTTPTDAQLHGLRDAIEHCRAHGPAGDEIKGHRDGYATDCPGGPLSAWVGRGAPRPGEDIPPPPTGGVPSFPGRSAFRLDVANPAVTELDRRLITKGFTRHNDGDGYQPGPVFTEYTRRNVADFQRAQGWTGSDADGYPGPESWRRLWS
ncbi:peptidoglycan-binding protein [Embleya sp. NBC_00888]|uniref:peptidoglycan-binding protein n=1 Tax=Embleya sp. NBC_00888 TaxID=2975960 RepID=UPI00386345C5|nr:peptidoglycan-binding protein [Embleya sp. NBC_00888]